MYSLVYNISYDINDDLRKKSFSSYICISSVIYTKNDTKYNRKKVDTADYDYHKKRFKRDENGYSGALVFLL